MDQNNQMNQDIKNFMDSMLLEFVFPDDMDTSLLLRFY
jgi:hypothetical protein